VTEAEMHGGGGDRATGLGHDAGVLEQPGYGRGDVRLAHRHHFIHVLLDVRERDVAGPQVHEAVGDARGGIQRDGVTGFEGAMVRPRSRVSFSARAWRSRDVVPSMITSAP
jgi:hypothetical protein